MDPYITEQEQLEKLKQFFKKYGATILVSVTLVLALSFGWHYWHARQEKIRGLASVGYEQMLNYLQDNKINEASMQAQYLIKEYPNTPYASAGSLMLAKIHVDKMDYAKAQQELQWVMNNSEVDVLRNVARIRYARIAIAVNQPKDALDTLEKFNDTGLNAVAEEVKGDAYTALGQKAKAESAYNNAINLLPKDAANLPLLEMKLNHVG